MNPFLYGKPVSDSQLFIGRDKELQRLLYTVEGKGNISIVGNLRIGKTSLLKRLKSLIQSEFPNIYPVFLDLQTLSPKDTEVQFWEKIFMQIKDDFPDEKLRSLAIKSYDDPSEPFRYWRFFNSLNKSDYSVVILLSEFEKLVSNSNFEEHFYDHLRSLSDKTNYVITSCTPLHILLDTIIDSRFTSPFYNIFMSTYLGLFHDDDVKHFFTQYLGNSNINFMQSEISFIVSIAGKHPYFLQMASFFMFEAYEQNLPRTERLSYTKKHFETEAAITFRDLWLSSIDSEKIVLTIFALLDSPVKGVKNNFNKDILTHPYAQSLRQLDIRGLVANNSLFSSCFSEWVRNEIKSELATSVSYDSWVKDSSNQYKLAQLKQDMTLELRDKILPKLKENYRELIISWLANPNTVKYAIDLLHTRLG